jgi:hypothetical protein
MYVEEVLFSIIFSMCSLQRVSSYYRFVQSAHVTSYLDGFWNVEIFVFSSLVFSIITSTKRNIYKCTNSFATRLCSIDNT